MSENSCPICSAETRANDHFCSSCGFHLSHFSRKPSKPFISLQRDFASAGIFTLVFGIIVGSFGFLIGVIPILALGLGSMILGVMVLLLPESVSVKAGRLAAFCGLPALMDIEALITDLDANSRGVYVPPAGFGSASKVLIPLRDSAIATLTHFPSSRLSRSRRVFVTLGTGLYERGILLFAPGAELVRALESSLQLDLGTIRLDELDQRLGFGFEMLGISKREVSIRVEGSTIKIAISLISLVDLEQRLRSETPRLIEQIGSPVTSAIAVVVAKTTRRFVRVLASSIDGSTLSCTLEILEEIPV